MMVADYVRSVLGTLHKLNIRPDETLFREGLQDTLSGKWCLMALPLRRRCSAFRRAQMPDRFNGMPKPERNLPPFPMFTLFLRKRMTASVCFLTGKTQSGTAKRKYIQETPVTVKGNGEIPWLGHASRNYL